MKMFTRKLYTNFCSKKLTLLDELSKSALRAMWAEQFYTTIYTTAQEKNTLLDHLLSLSLPAETKSYFINTKRSQEDKTQIENEMKKIENEMKNAFKPDEGVTLPDPLVQSQFRFTNARNNSLKFSFYPTRHITSKIFQTVQRNTISKHKQMIVGNKGISKSTAFLLAYHLSSINFRFRFGNKSIVADLVRQNLLREKFAKILYVSFNVEGNKNYNYFAKLLKCQCPELQKVFENFQKQNPSSEIQMTYETFKQWIKLIKFSYQNENIKCLLIVDQINALANIFHKGNQGENWKNKNPQADIDERTKITHLLTKCTRFENIYLLLSQQFDCLYNSSKNIEQDILDSSKSLTQHKLYLDVHQKLAQIKIDLLGKTTDPQYKKEVCRFIWFSCYNLLKTTQKKQELLKYCDALAQKSEIPLIVTPLSIRTVLQKPKNLQEINKMDDLNSQKANKKLKSFVDDIYTEVQNEGIESLKKKALKYLDDPDIEIQKDKYLIHLAWAIYFQEEIKNNNKNNTDEIKSQSVIKDQQQDELLHDKKYIKVPLENIKAHGLEENTIKKYLNKDLFKLESGYLVSEVSMEQLSAVSLSWLIKAAKQPSEAIMDVIRNSPTAAGQLIQKILIKWMESNPKSTFSIMRQTFQRMQFATFLHFSGKISNEKNCLSFNLKEMLKRAKNYLHLPYYILGSPITQESNPSTNSPSFDILALRYKSKKSIQIVTFDITINSNNNSINQKIKDAAKLIKQLINHHQLDQNERKKFMISKWKHIIIGKKSVMSKISKNKIQETINAQKLLAPEQKQDQNSDLVEQKLNKRISITLRSIKNLNLKSEKEGKFRDQHVYVTYLSLLSKIDQ